jgi:hypothetical protein
MQIWQEFHVPIILLNSFTTKKEKQGDQEVSQDVPYGGKLLDYWIQTEIKVQRTSQLSRRVFSTVKNRNSLPIPPRWSWILENKGFG